MPNRHDPNIKSKAIRLVREHRGDYPSEFAAIKVVAGRLGMTPETVRKWIRQAEVDEGTAPGTCRVPEPWSWPLICGFALDPTWGRQRA